METRVCDTCGGTFSANGYEWHHDRCHKPWLNNWEIGGPWTMSGSNGWSLFSDMGPQAFGWVAQQPEAALAAAAPDLYRALEKALGLMETGFGGWKNELGDECRAALRKARGEAP